MQDPRPDIRRAIEAGQLKQAILLLRDLIGREPNDAQAISTLGLLLVQSGDRTGAIDVMKRALQLAPRDYSIYFNLGSLQINVGEYNAAKETFDQACIAQPGALEWGLLGIVSLLPEFVESEDQINERVRAVERSLETLESSNKRIQSVENLRGNLFPIAYYGISTLDVQRRISELIVNRLAHPPKVSLKPLASGKRRIGIVSGLMRDHTIGKLNEGLIQLLNRERFTIVLIHLASSRKDALSTELDKSADEVIQLSTNTSTSIDTIVSLQLDVLHYLDIGMNAFTHRLAHFRLAPVQTTSWGHPVTSGISTIDYFVSFDMAEPVSGQAQYSEQLVRFRNPPTYYKKLAPHKTYPVDLPSGRLYGCLQSLFKLHPKFDEQLDAILSLDESAVLIFVEAENPTLTNQLKKRWESSFPLVVERSVFLPRMRRDLFLSVVESMDVLLDPPFFGSGNTLFESLCLGVPSVTWQGPFMRGRIAAAMYRYIGLEDSPVVDDLADYAKHAVNLANDKERLLRMKNEIITKSGVLYENDDVISEFEDFFHGVEPRG